MSFVTTLALGVALLVAVPYLAHRLRRRRAEERPFAPARLVEAAPPKARRRSKLEDRALFATRALAVIALAVLGASPLVRCSRLSLKRSGGASVALAIVLDDSMSMRADANGKTRFERARAGARELLASAREGDAVAIVLAGEPPRVALAATTDIAAAQAIVDTATPSDRATNLDASLALARGLVSGLPQVDKRIVVLSDLADANPDAPPLGQAGENSAIPVWVALPDIAVPAADCAIVSADQNGVHVRVAVACSASAAEGGRDVAIVDPKGAVLAHAPLPQGKSPELTLTLPSEAAQRADALTARLGGSDAIAADDKAPVVIEAGPGAVAVVADAAEEATATGGAPIVEQALAALKLDAAVRPLPAVPDRAEDLSPFVGIILDDPPGLTPEQRHALGAFFESGGVALLALGPRAAAAPLGASFEPILDHPIAWTDSTSKGADPGTASGPMTELAETLADLAAKKRAQVAAEDTSKLESFLKWSDGAPLIARRSIGRGEAWLTTLPFSVDASDLTLRPAFLAMLDAWVAEARARSAPRRTDVGAPWTFPGVRRLLVRGPEGPLPESREQNAPRVAPPVIGRYEIDVDGKREARVAAPVAREVDIRPRGASQSAVTATLGDSLSQVDASSSVALVLLLILTAEIALRVWSDRRASAAQT